MNSIPRSSHTAVSESTAKKPPKVVDYLLVRPKPDGGHDVEHHYTHSKHKAELHTFGAGKAEGRRASAHLLRHAGLPHPKLEEQGDSEPEPYSSRILKSASYRR